MKLLIVISVLLSTISFAQKSPFNGKEIKVDSNCIFLVGAHFHGASTNQSGFPASTLLANLDQINETKADFLISLGDLFLSINKSKDNYQRSFFNKLDLPLFNAVGNHDIEEDNYTKYFGDRFFSFEVANSVFVILDTELDNGSVEGEQLDFLKEVYQKNPEQVFLFSHRPIWSENDDELDDVFKGNTRSGTNYDTDILPFLLKQKSKTWFFSGSLGGESPFSFFYHKKAENLIYLATAIRDLNRDGILQVELINGNVRITPMSFTGQKLQNIEFYNLDRWQSTNGSAEFNWRLVPLYLKQMVFHRYFWYGIFWTLIGVLGIWIVKRLWRRRKKA